MYLIVHNENIQDNTVALCVICKIEINQIKSYAMERHYKTHEDEVKKMVHPKLAPKFNRKI